MAAQAGQGLGNRILKVNHAGEFGAICIYTGQIAIAKLFARDLVTELQEFRTVAISAIVSEERLHHDQAASHIEEGSLWYRILKPVVSAATESVIWMGMRL